MSTNLDVLGASDEELLGMSAPPAAAMVTPEKKEPETQESPGEQPVQTEDEDPAEGAAGPEAEEEPEAEVGGTTEEPDQQAVPTKQAAEAPPVKTPDKEPEKAEASSKAPPADTTDYKAFYDRITAPIKAAGKTIQVTSPDEVITLMQKGLDYTRKTTELSGQRKYIMMLESAGLLDQEALELLIAVHNKEPEALKRFFKKSKIDPVDIDTTKEDNYKPGAHAVSDQEARLQEAIDDLKAADGGEETLRAIGTWDQASKKIFWDQPGLLDALHQQRKNGVYDVVSKEVDRRRALGQIPSGMPFLHAYKAVGDELQARGVLGGGTQSVPKAPAPAGGSAPVTRRPASAPPVKTPGKSAARAAAATRTTPRTTQSSVPNFMAMSDEEILSAKVKF